MLTTSCQRGGHKQRRERPGVSILMHRSASGVGNRTISSSAIERKSSLMPPGKPVSSVLRPRFTGDLAWPKPDGAGQGRRPIQKGAGGGGYPIWERGGCQGRARRRDL